MPEDYLTVNEIAAELKLNQQTVRNWIDRGELPSVRAGARRVRVTREALDEFLRASTANPVEHPKTNAQRIEQLEQRVEQFEQRVQELEAQLEQLHSLLKQSTS